MLAIPVYNLKKPQTEPLKTHVVMIVYELVLKCKKGNIFSF